ncbi:hypothetical protein E2C01_056201 [Portunus trituberculatus]|uniref:Uncharacterized protein n=1 Tax=Portunus trituberculatus TaxID=210409 RepID=A0A5B7GYZ1_PORTR|nr:hypothetical protein [Portunus trituberculatus]
MLALLGTGTDTGTWGHREAPEACKCAESECRSGRGGGKSIQAMCFSVSVAVKSDTRRTPLREPAAT